MAEESHLLGKVDVIDLVHLLKRSLKSRAQRRILLNEFETLVGENLIIGVTDEEDEILRKLASDHAFYSPGQHHTDGAFFGDDKMTTLVIETLAAFKHLPAAKSDLASDR